MTLALVILAYGLYLGLGFAGVMFWRAVRERPLAVAFIAWSTYAAGAWALGFLLLGPTEFRVWAAAGPLFGPAFVVLCYVNNQLRNFPWGATLSQASWKPNSPPGVADGD